jgi:hypothetical protein
MSAKGVLLIILMKCDLPTYKVENNNEKLVYIDATNNIALF